MHLSSFYLAKRLSHRTKQLREIQMDLQMLETEISYAATPLEAAFRKISQTNTGVIGDLFFRCTHYLETLDGATTYECWEKSLKEIIPHLAMKPLEIEWLHHFGKIIGNSDRADQQKHLKLMMAKFKQAELEAREEQLKHEKMYKTLGFLTGALIVIVLI
ncbi:stage III sporulation protein SpoIIIAB [Caldalkalibacillus mannanilyticus]|uniref:stage III sporulation protein SpoIIIAB n=1 Tax=Caldalkalibacillus mannanilyticus TaxID=1418 RepID=UPI00131F19CC|nr:stage III sporulation protein SpoIIIAB [Caldalkalibacillus mannanilyticus]